MSELWRPFKDINLSLYWEEIRYFEENCVLPLGSELDKLGLKVFNHTERTALNLTMVIHNIYREHYIRTHI